MRENFLKSFGDITAELIQRQLKEKIITKESYK